MPNYCNYDYYCSIDSFHMKKVEFAERESVDYLVSTFTDKCYSNLISTKDAKNNLLVDFMS